MLRRHRDFGKLVINEALERSYDDPRLLLKGYDLSQTNSTDIEKILTKQYDDNEYNVILAAIQYTGFMDNKSEIAIWKYDDETPPNNLKTKTIKAVWFTDFANGQIAAELFYYLPDVENYSVRWPSRLRIIADETFLGAKRITDMKVPNTVAKIDDYAFSGCANMESIYAPTVWVLGEGVFSGCYSLTNIKLSKHLEEIPEYCFKYTGIKNLDFLKDRKVKTIGRSAFSCCTGLVDVVVPETVEFVDTHAFYQCINLKSIRFLNPNVKLADRVFTCCRKLNKDNIIIG